MKTQQKIRKQLLELGATGQEATKIMKEVTELIVRKTFSALLECLPQAEQKKLNKMPLKQAELHFKDIRMPPLSTDEFKRVYMETWEEYFSFMKSK